MSEEQLKEEVDNIIALSYDDEKAHRSEDDLHLEVIQRFCPEWVANEIQRLRDAGFARWCA